MPLFSASIAGRDLPDLTIAGIRIVDGNRSATGVGHGIMWERKFTAEGTTVEWAITYKQITVSDRLGIDLIKILDGSGPEGWQRLIDALETVVESVTVAGRSADVGLLPDSIGLEVLLGHPSFRPRNKDETERDRPSARSGTSPPSDHEGPAS